MRYALLTCAALSFALTGCSHYSNDLSNLDKEMGTQVAHTAAPQDIAPAAGGVGGSRALSQNLAREYYAMARYENDKAYDYKASKLYTKKAVMAAKGEAVAPSKVTSYDIAPEYAAELTAARGDLVTALKDNNIPENAGALAAAQARYECWLDRAEEASEDAHFAQCKSEFEAAMAQLVMPAAGLPAGQAYDIGFAQNTTVIEPAQVDTIALIANFMNDPAHAGYTVTMTGYGAAQGEFAIKLATNRVNAVRSALQDKGVAGERLAGLLSPAILSEGAPGKVNVMLVPPPSQTTVRFVPVDHPAH